jgi:cell division protein FtsL
MWLRLNLLLLVLLIGSALLLVRQSHEGRRLFAELERAKSEGRKLEADLHRLRAEREGEATNLRVDQLAREKLQMRPITPALTLQAASSPAASGASR